VRFDLVLSVREASTNTLTLRASTWPRRPTDRPASAPPASARPHRRRRRTSTLGTPAAIDGDAKRRTRCADHKASAVRPRPYASRDRVRQPRTTRALGTARQRPRRQPYASLGRVRQPRPPERRGPHASARAGGRTLASIGSGSLDHPSAGDRMPAPHAGGRTRVPAGSSSLRDRTTLPLQTKAFLRGLLQFLLQFHCGKQPSALEIHCEPNPRDITNALRPAPVHCKIPTPMKYRYCLSETNGIGETRPRSGSAVWSALGCVILSRARRAARRVF
jgi:hypothetical protein